MDIPKRVRFATVPQNAGKILVDTEAVRDSEDGQTEVRQNADKRIQGKTDDEHHEPHEYSTAHAHVVPVDDARNWKHTQKDKPMWR